MSLNLDEVLLVERLHLPGEIVERGLRVFVELIRSGFEAHAIFGERLLENNFPLRQHARFLRAFERVLRFFAELIDANIRLREIGVRRLLLLLQVFDLTFDRIDLLIGRRLHVGDLLVHVARRGARRQAGGKDRNR